MARSYSLIVSLNGTPVSVLGVSVGLRLDGQSVASVQLDPTSTTAIGVNESDLWDVVLSYTVPSGGTTTQKIITGGRARGASYSQRFRGGSTDRNIDIVRTVLIADRFAAFRDYGPASTVTRLATDSHRELAFVCSRIGISGGVASMDRVEIDRIDYTRDASYWDTLLPYFAPFDPITVLDPSTAALRMYDPTLMHAAAPRSDRVLTLADYNPADWSTDLRPIVTQVRVDYRAFGPATTGRRVSPSATRTDEEHSVEDDGTQSRTWTGYTDLYDDPVNPTTVTRSVVAEQGIVRTDPDGLISSTVSAFTYEADYSQLVSTETVVSGSIELPFAGPWTGELERTVEEREYEADTIVPGRYFLKRTTATTTGLYVYNYSSEDVDGTQAKETATPVKEAWHGGFLDATPSSSQRFAIDRTRTVIETYERNQAANTVTISGVETDSLRGRTVRTWQRTEIGDNALTPIGRTAHFYVDGSDTYGERRAAVVNAQLVGPNIGRAIATRQLAQSGQPIRSARITLTRPDYRRYRLGLVCELDTDAPYSMAGLWFIRGVTFEAAAPSEATAPVVQSLELVRSWS